MVPTNFFGSPPHQVRFELANASTPRAAYKALAAATRSSSKVSRTEKAALLGVDAKRVPELLPRYAAALPPTHLRRLRQSVEQRIVQIEVKLAEKRALQTGSINHLLSTLGAGRKLGTSDQHAIRKALEAGELTSVQSALHKLPAYNDALEKQAATICAQSLKLHCLDTMVAELRPLIVPLQRLTWANRGATKRLMSIMLGEASRKKLVLKFKDPVFLMVFMTVVPLLAYMAFEYLCTILTAKMTKKIKQRETEKLISANNAAASLQSRATRRDIAQVQSRLATEEPYALAATSAPATT